MTAGCEKTFLLIVRGCLLHMCRNKRQKTITKVEERFNHPNPNYACESVKPMQFLFPPPPTQTQQLNDTNYA